MMTYLLISVVIAVLASTTLSVNGQQSGSCNIGTIFANESTEYLTSPGYPFGLQNNTVCTYTIFSSLQAIMLKLVDFEVTNYDCDYDTTDYVSIYDGLELVSSNIIAKLCGQIGHVTYMSSGPYMTVTFHSGGDIMYKGFKFEYQAIHTSEICEDTKLLATDSPKYLASPNYPQPYLSDTSCQWLITSNNYNSDTIIELELLDFTCYTDLVSIYDGNSTASPLVDDFCGNVASTTFTSTGSSLLIVYQSNNYGSERLYNFQYSSRVKPGICDGLSQYWASDNPKYITTPGYPSSYTSDQFCQFTITSSLPSNGVVLNVIDLDLPYTEGCLYSYVSIYNGDLGSDNPRIGTLCGHDSNNTYISSASYLTLLFNSDYSATNTKFKLEYSSRDMADLCNTSLSASSTPRYFGSPNYPNDYPSNLNCQWRISASSPNEIIHLTSVKFDLADYDNVIIYDGPNTTALRNVPITGLDAQTIIDVFSTGNAMTVTFSTSMFDDTGFSGFQFEYVAQNRSALCRATQLTATSYATTNIESPDHTSQFPSNMHCEWHISSTSTQLVVLKIDEFFINDTSPSCSNKYLAIYDGSSTNSKLLDRLCGSNVADTQYTSTGTEMTVVFHSDASVAAADFQLSYTATNNDDTCNSTTLTASDFSSYIQSHNYPYQYPRNTECLYSITTNDGAYLVYIDIDSIDVGDNTNDCHSDYITIYDGSTTSSDQLVTLCGSSAYPSTYQSTGTDMLIVFHAGGGSQNHNGFQISYTTVSNSNFGSGSSWNWSWSWNSGEITIVATCSVAVPLFVVVLILIFLRRAARRNVLARRAARRNLSNNTQNRITNPAMVKNVTTNNQYAVPTGYVGVVDPVSVFNPPPYSYSAEANGPPSYSSVVSEKSEPRF